MWIVKGVLLGIVLFIIGGISYVGIRIGIALYLVNGGTAGGAQSDFRIWHFRIWPGPLHIPVLLPVFLAAVAIGLWIMRARTTTV